MDKLMTVQVLAQTYKPQSLVYKAMHQDYTSEYIVGTEIPSEFRCGQLIVERLLKGNRGHYGCLKHICPKTLIRMGKILDSGAVKYGENNWKNIPTQDHLNHALVHIYGFLDGNTDDDHLGHALTRVMFALSMELNVPYGE
jgi:hypothetical protein